MAVSRGWTGECLKVRIYEAVDRYSLRWMDKVICVSDAQAAKVRRAGIGEERIEVIANAVDPDRFVEADKRDRAKLTRYFRQPRTRIIGAAGRLSPEKGFDVLIAAAEVALKRDPGLGFILFGDGPCRKALQKQIQVSGLQGQFILGGFRTDLDRFLPCFDVLVLPSYTEGLPNVVLEACAASVPVVATAVGGTPEVIEDELSGFLVPPGEPEQLADRICQAIESEEFRLQMGQRGRERVLEQFSFAAQAERYIALFESFGSKPVGASSEPDSSKLVDTESPCHS
jgi:glycosyltransferase involved in cell wall biosynthesis